MSTPAGRDCLVFVESNLTGTGMQAILIARSLGLRCVFVTARLSRYTGNPAAARVIEENVERVLACDTLDPLAVERCLLDAGIRPAGVMTIGEHYVPTATAVARNLGLPGLDPVAAVTARNKLSTRIACRQAPEPVPVPEFRFVGSLDQIDEALAAVGLPCVVKPADETASIGVSLCRDRAEVERRIVELLALRQNSRGQDHEPGGLVEQCLFGPEVSVETFTYDGSTTVLGVTDKGLGPVPYFLETGHVFPSILPPSLAEEAARTAVAALDAVGFDFGPAHTELKLTEHGPVLIEINPRTGGDYIPDLVQHATGVRLLEQSIVAHLGRRPELCPTRSAGAAIRFLTGRDGVVEAVDGEQLRDWFPSVVELRVTVGPGSRTREPTNSHDRLGHLLTVADTPQEAARQADAALNHLAVRYAAAPDTPPRC